MEQPVVGIVMGSDSDWPLVQKACATLASFGVAYETRVISAHRTPEVALDYSRTAEARGLKVMPPRIPHILDTANSKAGQPGKPPRS